jgi:penicillin-binding protein 1A
VLGEMNDMLKTAVEVGTGKGARIGGWDIGGKTGTSQESRDALFVGYTSAMVTGVWLGNDDNKGTSLSGGNVPANIWSQFMTKALEGKTPNPIPGGSYAGQLVAQQMIDPATGQPIIDPMTGQPQVQYVDGGTGQPVQTQVDPATGQVVAIDPATGLPIDGMQPIQSATANPPIQTGTMVDPVTGLPIEGQAIDPATGLPMQSQQIDPQTGMPLDTFGQGGATYDAYGQQIDPQTGLPIQSAAPSAPIDPETGLPMTLITDPATGEQVWVPSAPAQQQQTAPVYPQGQIVPPADVQQQQQPQVIYESPNQQRTLMDLIFGG